MSKRKNRPTKNKGRNYQYLLKVHKKWKMLHKRWLATQKVEKDAEKS